MYFFLLLVLDKIIPQLFFFIAVKLTVLVWINIWEHPGYVDPTVVKGECVRVDY